MYAAHTSVTRACSGVTPFWGLEKNRDWVLISSLRAGSIVTTGFTLATTVSFTTPALLADYGADRWKMFLSRISRMATKSEFEMSCDFSIVAKWWIGRARAWVSNAIAS
jgi:hypothetical protein